ncbi:tyrosine-type recombinase/integrase [Natronobeatus ordinarius]|uniref:tyrosine-type recombinase/integrase n=1 Tax=Natronobeatus ordinarius TaxID=2963433 RepID=UPI0020CCF7A5|nr:site-specific integrase [Natronobeatus ordinarius]
MQPGDSGATPGKTPLKDALEECLETKGRLSPNYRENFERVVGSWIDFCHRRNVEALEDVTERTMAAFAGHLARRVEAGQSDGVDGGIAASTAWTYYDYVSAFLSWAVKWDYLTENPAEKARAREPMPARPSSGEYNRQFWQSEQRQTVVDYVRRRVDSAYRHPIAPKPVLHKRLRDRALVATLAYTGVRGGEILNDPTDDRRAGLRWKDVDLEDGRLRILGKNQQVEDAQLPTQAARPLRRWKDALEPTASDWPVFPSMHVPTLSRKIAAELGPKERSKRVSTSHHWAVVLDEEIEPPSITTEGVRSILKRLTDAADVPGLGEDEYLTLHGARRGVGEKLYRERGHAAAQRTLRHADPSTTSEMYAHIEASELADDVSEVFNGE